MAGDAQFAAEFEQVMLDLGQAVPHRSRHACVGQDHADRAVRLVNGTVRFDACAVFRRSRTIAETGAAIVTGTRVNLAESFAHK
jgi:hypothetical protein